MDLRVEIRDLGKELRQADARLEAKIDSLAEYVAEAIDVSNRSHDTRFNSLEAKAA